MSPLRNQWLTLVLGVAALAAGPLLMKLLPPLNAPDYGTYLAQLKPNVDAIFLGFAGSNGFKFLRQFNEFGMKGKIAVVGGMTALAGATMMFELLCVMAANLAAGRR